MALLDDIPKLEQELRSRADAERADEMSAYLKDQFELLGVPTPARRAALKKAIDTRIVPDRDDLKLAVDELFALPEREFHYCAVDLARRWQRVLIVDDLPWLETLITTHSWWDTVDAIATHPVGHVVRADRSSAQPILERWIAADDLWLNRSAILHQLLYKDETDSEQLFRYCDLHADSKLFFHRKAIGWALRQYARTDPDAVRSYVESRRQRLSGLTIREALKHL